MSIATRVIAGFKEAWQFMARHAVPGAYDPTAAQRPRGPNGQYLAPLSFANKVEEWDGHGHVVKTRYRPTQAEIDEADLSFRDLRDVDFSGLNLSDRSLRGSCCAGAIFDHCKLVRTSFVGTDMKGATLKGAHGRHTDFRGAVFALVTMAGEFSPLINAADLVMEGATITDPLLGVHPAYPDRRGYYQGVSTKKKHGLKPAA